jgi:predicted AlkP superfamily phosphohydrolase/phosphomutase
MTSGRDAGELGLYGFRNRIKGGYGLRTADSRDVRVKRVWDYLSDAGHRVAPLFVPLTYPPSPVRGVMASCFLTPPGAPFTFPPALGAQLTERFGAYHADVRDFRTDDLARIWDELHAMAVQHVDIARDVLARQSPEFMMMVEMGPDRFHHAFFASFDPAHPLHRPGDPYADAPERYYAFLDAQLGRLLADVPPECTVMIVSDHGAKAMQGGFCINDWLRQQGWLAHGPLPSGAGAGPDAGAPAAVAPLREAGVRWAETRAWAEGGYYARVFLNVEGREPEGRVPRADYERTRDELIEALGRVTRPDGSPFPIRAVKPDRVYREARGEPPDLMLYLDDLNYRALATVGHPALFRQSNDGGPDGCNHDWEGVFVAAGPGVPAGERVEGATLFDVTPTALGRFGLSVPGLLGRDLLARG